MYIVVLMILIVGYKIYWYVKESKKNRYEKS